MWSAKNVLALQGKGHFWNLFGEKAQLYEEMMGIGPRGEDRKEEREKYMREEGNR